MLNMLDAKCAGYLELQSLQAESKKMSEWLLDYCLVNNRVKVLVLYEEIDLYGNQVLSN